MTKKEFKEKGSIRIEELGLRTRAYYALRRLNCATVAEVIQAGPGAVWGCRNCGITTLREINAKIEGLGLKWPGFDRLADIKENVLQSDKRRIIRKVLM